MINKTLAALVMAISLVVAPMAVMAEQPQSATVVLEQCKSVEAKALDKFNSTKEKAEKDLEVMRDAKAACTVEQKALAEMNGNTMKIRAKVNELENKIDSLIANQKPFIEKDKELTKDNQAILTQVNSIKAAVDSRVQETKQTQGTLDKTNGLIVQEKKKMTNVMSLIKSTEDQVAQLNETLKIKSASLAETSKAVADLSAKLGDLRNKEDAAKQEALEPIDQDNVDTSGMDENEIRATLQKVTLRQQEIQEKRDKALRSTVEARLNCERQVKRITDQNKNYAFIVEQTRESIELRKIELSELTKKAKDIADKLSLLTAQRDEVSKMLAGAQEKEQAARDYYNKENARLSESDKQLAELRAKIKGIDDEIAKANTEKGMALRQIEEIVKQMNKTGTKLTILNDKLSTSIALYSASKKAMLDAEQEYRATRINRIKAEVELKLEQMGAAEQPKIFG